jgi:uncharacterized protein YjiS (DUF1127 family)
MIMQNVATKPTARVHAHGPLRLITALMTAWQTFARRHRQRRTIAVLEGLDDRTLKDIGLYRSEIQSVVKTCGSGRRLTFAGRC